MLYNPTHEERLGRVAERIQFADAVMPELVSEVIADACVRLRTLGANATARLARLIAAGAWTDAALALLEIELPTWSLRRIVCEDGEWECSVSPHPNLPLELEGTVHATHAVLPLALLAALVEARRRLQTDGDAVARFAVRSAPSDCALCCENFS
jgi:hypothetical protein